MCVLYLLARQLPERVQRLQVAARLHPDCCPGCMLCSSRSPAPAHTSLMIFFTHSLQLLGLEPLHGPTNYTVMDLQPSLQQAFSTQQSSFH